MRGDEMKRKFEVEVDCNFGSLDTVIIELDQKVIDVVDDEWRKYLYDLKTPEEIAEHITFNMIVNKLTLTQLDGWVDLSDDMAKISKYPEKPEWEFRAKEMK
jgi:hypothetical protein